MAVIESTAPDARSTNEKIRNPFFNNSPRSKPLETLLRSAKHNIKTPLNYSKGKSLTAKAHIKKQQNADTKNHWMLGPKVESALEDIDTNLDTPISILIGKIENLFTEMIAGVQEFLSVKNNELENDVAEIESIAMESANEIEDAIQPYRKNGNNEWAAGRKAREYLRGVRLSAEKYLMSLKSQIKALLTMAKSGNVNTIEPQEVDLHEYLQSIFVEWEPTVTSIDDMEFNTSIDSGSISGGTKFRLDPIKVKEVFDNLISNAIEAVKDHHGNKVITIKANIIDGKSLNRCLEFTIENKPGAINSDDTALIFEPRVSIGKDHDRHDASLDDIGLGLPSANEICSLHTGGYIELINLENPVRFRTRIYELAA